MSHDQDPRGTQDDTELELDDELEKLANKLAETPAPQAAPPSGGPPSKLLGVLGLIGVALLGVGGVFAYQRLTDKPPPVRAESIAAKLELAAGEVVLLAGEGGSDERLLSGTPLPVGAKLRTGTGARALIRLADGSRIFLNEATSIELGDDTGVSVLAGEIWLETPPLDEKRDPLQHHVGPASLAISDGGASLTLTSEGATIYVAAGIASVTSEGGRKEVRSGERAVVNGSAAPIIEPVVLWDDWTGGLAERGTGSRIGGGSGSLYAVDRHAPPGTPARSLSISSQSVDVAIDGGLAETRVDQRFFNPSDRDVEGWYWFTVPEGATLVGFALETNGELVDGEIVEKKQAVATYERAVASDDNPALLEWIDEHTVRARIYPVPAMGERRIVVRYQQLLSESNGKLDYSYPLAGAGGRDAATIDEFSLAVELRGDLAKRYAVSTLDEATVANGGALITMRRTGFTPRADFELELTRQSDVEKAAPLRLSQYDGGANQARFVMLRWLPDLDFSAFAPPRADVVVVVDTSAFGDDAEHDSRIAVAEALLRSLSGEDRFALMAADLSAEVLFPAQELSQATPEAIDEALAALQAYRPGGATDLGAIFERALTRLHGTEQPAIVYVGDGLATSGERGADELAERLRRALSDSRARLFTVGVGPAVEDRLLARLARIGGGESLRVESADQAVVQALELSGALKTPTITELELELGEGLDDRFDNATGKLARGQELVILARTHHELPETVTIRGRLGGQSFEQQVPLTRTKGSIDFVVPKLWASARIERLLGDGRGEDAVRGKVLALGLEYGLMTPFTSFLALESERAYARQGVERRKRPWDFELLGAVLPHALPIEPDHGRHFDRVDLSDAPSAGELLLGALSAPIGCVAKREDAPAAESIASAPKRDDDDAGGQGQRHRGEEGMMGKPSSSADRQLADPAEPADVDMVMEEEAAAYDEAPAPPAEPSPSPEPTSLSVSGYGKGGGGAAPGGAPAAARPMARGSGNKDKKASRDDYDGGDDFRSAPELEPEAVVDAPRGGAFAIGEDDAEVWGGLEGSEQLAQDGAAGIDSGIGSGSSGGKRSAKQREQEKRERMRRPKVVSPVARAEKQSCSDASARSLAQRKLLWEQRLERAPDMIARLRAYENAAASCELDRGSEQRVFLQLLQSAAATEGEIELLLAHFESQAESRSFLARALLRRLVDPALVGAVERSLFGGELDWLAVDQEAARAATAGEALDIVDAALARHADAGEDERLPLELLRIDLLFELGRVDEAIATGRKLRELGLITPLLAQRLGELLVEAGQVDEAKRVFSEIVEYDPSSESTRRLLGDIFLRHGWYQEAYRQYQDLVALSGQPTDVIRMARAAAGAGRVDEGTRLLRQVAGGEGRPGVDDPRRFARLHAAVLLGELLADEGDLPTDKLERELERLQLFDAPTTWTLITWNDLEHELMLGVEPLPEDADAATRDAARKAALRVSDGRSAGDTGLWAIQSGELDDLIVRHRGDVPTRAVSFQRLTIRWDGQHFTVTRSLGTIAAKAARQGDEGDASKPE